MMNGDFSHMRFDRSASNAQILAHQTQGEISKTLIPQLLGDGLMARNGQEDLEAELTGSRKRVGVEKVGEVDFESQ